MLGLQPGDVGYTFLATFITVMEDAAGGDPAAFLVGCGLLGLGLAVVLVLVRFGRRVFSAGR